MTFNNFHFLSTCSYFPFLSAPLSSFSQCLHVLILWFCLRQLRLAVAVRLLSLMCRLLLNCVFIFFTSKRSAWFSWHCSKVSTVHEVPEYSISSKHNIRIKKASISLMKWLKEKCFNKILPTYTFWRVLWKYQIVVTMLNRSEDCTVHPWTIFLYNLILGIYL